MNKGGHMRKNKHRFFVIGALAIIVLALQPLVGLVFGDTSATQPPSYSFISIDIPNSSGELGFTGLSDINDKGQIAGAFATGPQGFLLDNKFEVVDIQCPGATSTGPQSINKHGEITGFCLTDNKIRGFVFHKKSKDRKHAFLDSPSATFARHAGINDHNQMVGDHRDGKYTLLDFPGANFTEAIGINDDGQVVGDYFSDGRFHGFFWDAGLFLTFDVPFPGATSTGPNGINNVGQIVGFYDDDTGGRHGFLYDRGIFIAFDFPGSRLTAPTDINDDGQIVGVYVDDDDILKSFLLENGRFTTIDVPFSGVIFTDVNGINNRGQIVGRYLTSNPGDPFNAFLNHGFIGTPETEPKNKSKFLVSKSNDSSKSLRLPQDVDTLSKSFAKWARRLQ
jgi:probable HAF family extracellular repeat protein